MWSDERGYFFRRRRSGAWPWSLRSYGQFDRKARARSDRALDENPSAVRLDDVLDDGEAESGGTGRGAVDVPLCEAFEQVVADLGGNPGPAIAHAQLHGPPPLWRSPRFCRRR